VDCYPKFVPTPPEERPLHPIGERGYAMAALIVGMAIIGLMATIALPVWTQAAQREKEAELVFRGEQYARAVGLFQRKMGPGTLPPNLDVLVDQQFLRKKFKDPITNKNFRPVSTAEAGIGGGGGPNGGAGATTVEAKTGAGSSPGGAGLEQRNVASGLGDGPREQGVGLQGPRSRGPTGSGQGAGVALDGITGVVSTSRKASIRLYNGRDHYDQWLFVYNAQTTMAGLGGQPGEAGGPAAQGAQNNGGRPAATQTGVPPAIGSGPDGNLPSPYTPGGSR
jgi:type II secretory pathway pseudopilin PulG